MKWKQVDDELLGTCWCVKIDERLDAWIFVNWGEFGFSPVVGYDEDEYTGPSCATLTEAQDVGHSMLLALTAELIEQFNKTNKKFRAELR